MRTFFFPIPMHDADVARAFAEPPRHLSPRERAAVLARITALIEFWGITPEELASEAPPPPPPLIPVIKYRHPITGETWDGSGLHPEWMRKALLKEGYRVEELKPGISE